MLLVDSVRNQRYVGKIDSVFTEYVGRSCGQYRGSVLGNPFKIGRNGSREEVIAKYRRWLWKEMQKKEAVWFELVRLGRKYLVQQQLVLVCWCYPEKCHAEIIKNAIEWMIREGHIQ